MTCYYYNICRGKFVKSNTSRAPVARGTLPLPTPIFRKLVYQTYDQILNSL
uniref:Uncharacterized protein n=1 Tax=Siphoviridae sp. ctBCr48 TaxID=2827802 RepID=A0A8S5SIG0_9CAUD|nr:MAG TPA: hypothetical protein [Siphoviridae sp. ctBCr48]